MPQQALHYFGVVVVLSEQGRVGMTGATRCRSSCQNPSELAALGIPTHSAARRASKQLESLRNSLAHGQGFVEQDWPQVVWIARRIQQIVHDSNQQLRPSVIPSNLIMRGPVLLALNFKKRSGLRIGRPPYSGKHDSD
jgi:hypothetical protein